MPVKRSETGPLPGTWQMYDDSIDRAIERFLTKHGVLPEAVVIHTTRRITSLEARALKEYDVQLLQLCNVHDVWCGVVPE